MRIFDRIASGESVMAWDAGGPVATFDAKWRKLSHTCIRVVADNAAAYLALHPYEKDAPIESFGTILAPFQDTWIEWVRTDGISVAMYVHALPEKDYYRGLRPLSANLAYAVGPDIHVSPLQSVATTFIDAAGKPTCQNITTLGGEPAPDFGGWFHPGWLAIAWMNCKNMNLVGARTPVGIAKKRRRRTGFAGHDYYRIEVAASHRRKWEKSAGVSAERFHTVKGSLATYTDENPMFGIPGRTGTYWRPGHARGDKSLGSINKEYHVEGATS